MHPILGVETRYRLVLLQRQEEREGPLRKIDRGPRRSRWVRTICQLVACTEYTGLAGYAVDQIKPIQGTVWICHYHDFPKWRCHAAQIKFHANDLPVVILAE